MGIEQGQVCLATPGKQRKLSLCPLPFAIIFKVTSPQCYRGGRGEGESEQFEKQMMFLCIALNGSPVSTCQSHGFLPS